MSWTRAPEARSRTPSTTLGSSSKELNRSLGQDLLGPRDKLWLSRYCPASAHTDTQSSVHTWLWAHETSLKFAARVLLIYLLSEESIQVHPVQAGSSTRVGHFLNPTSSSIMHWTRISAITAAAELFCPVSSVNFVTTDGQASNQKV